MTENYHTAFYYKLWPHDQIRFILYLCTEKGKECNKNRNTVSSLNHIIVSEAIRALSVSQNYILCVIAQLICSVFLLSLMKQICLVSLSLPLVIILSLSLRPICTRLISF